MIERRLRNIVLSGFGNQIRKENDLVKIVVKEENDKKIFSFSPHEIEQIIIAGETSVTSGVIRLLLENSVDLVFVQHRPNFFARVIRGDSNLITDLWRKQINLDDNKKLGIAKEIIDCAIYNKIRLLQGITRNRNVDFENEINEMNVARNSIADSRNNNELMGVEGHATKTYFGSLYKLIPKEFGFIKREKHPPKDPVNAMLSYGYTVLRSRVEYGLMLAGLNIYGGIIHSTYRDRVSLGFDLMEEFRQPIVDRAVLTMIVRGQVRVEDFDLKPDMCYMDEELKRKYLDILYCRLEEKYVYEKQKISFLDIIFEQAKKLAKTISREEMYHGFRWR